MAKGVLVVYTTPAEAREDDFNRWYTETHVPELLKLPGFTSGTRYKLSSEQLMPGAQAPGPYLALYDIEGDDLKEVVGGIMRGFQDGSITRGDASAPGGSLLIFEEVAERQEA